MACKLLIERYWCDGRETPTSKTFNVKVTGDVTETINDDGTVTDDFTERVKEFIQNTTVDPVLQADELDKLVNLIQRAVRLDPSGNISWSIKLGPCTTQ